MSRKPGDWHTQHWAALFTFLGVLATLAGAVIIVYQIKDARKALLSANAYMIEKDLIDALDRMHDLVAKRGESPNGVGAESRAAQADLDRAASHLDNVIEATSGLKNNGGISDETWGFFLRAVCRPLDQISYRIGSTSMAATREACNAKKTLWED
jgi:hypothetical protein